MAMILFVTVLISSNPWEVATSVIGEIMSS